MSLCNTSLYFVIHSHAPLRVFVGLCKTNRFKRVSTGRGCFEASNGFRVCNYIVGRMVLLSFIKINDNVNAWMSEEIRWCDV